MIKMLIKWSTMTAEMLKSIKRSKRLKIGWYNQFVNQFSKFLIKSTNFFKSFSSVLEFNWFKCSILTFLLLFLSIFHSDNLDSDKEFWLVFPIKTNLIITTNLIPFWSKIGLLLILIEIGPFLIKIVDYWRNLLE